eukprot:CAMPEP_0170782056 /NCGR_PEP_ID=MMETSP0733-20121128/14618_1 /TAXON_ID=186038 /ORGANISM="Fragilariopsis kerguelensis, Strain L26-C5" /LENGTH=66 /DNA_ID=CAMNT_0011126315 /DNA_START=92 /DNA_END=292 /DNA_ORIENTATION=+
MVQHPKTGTEHEKSGNGVPETTNVKEGSASRNIQRKHDPKKGKDKKMGGGSIGGKGDWKQTNDGSM